MSKHLTANFVKLMNFFGACFNVGELVCRRVGVSDLDLDNSRQEPEAITATSGCALRKSGEPTLEGRYCVGLSN